MTSPSSTPQAVVVHAMPGRVRLRFDHQRGSSSFFEELRTTLEKQSNVQQVRASAHTGSVLVLHNGDYESFVAQAQKKGLFEVVLGVTPSAAPLRKLRNAIDAADDRVAKETNDTLSVGKLVFLGLISAGIYQANRGHLWPAGLTLFKHALELMDWVAEREPTNSQQRA